MRILGFPLLCTMTWAATSLLTPWATAQDPTQDQEQSVGFGVLKRAFNMTKLAGMSADTFEDEDIRGVVWIDGLLYVSGTNGGQGPGGTSPDADHQIYVVDPETTTLLGSFSIPEPHQSSVHGALGLDKDCVGNILAAGAEGVAVFDTAGNQVDTISGVCTDGSHSHAADGEEIELPKDGNGDPVVHSNAPIEYCGVAYDPEGDGGIGSLWVAECDPIDDAIPSVYELRIMDGAVVREFPNEGYTTNGIVFDPLNGNLWTNSGNPLGLMELDIKVDLMPTGHFMDVVPPQATMQLSAGFGGMTIIPGGDPASPWDSAFDLVSVSQQVRVDGTRHDDFIGFHRLHQTDGLLGYSESLLVGSVGQDPFGSESPIMFQAGDTLNWRMISNGRGNFGGPALIIINLGPDARRDAVTFIPGLFPQTPFPELVALLPFSTPPSLEEVYLDNANVGFTTSVPLPPGFPVLPGDIIRLQAIYVESQATVFSFPGLAASNELWFRGKD
jgi:hypothetical protein